MYSDLEVDNCRETTHHLEKRLFDVVIVGGGVAGLGIALEFSRSGFDVVLLERGYLARETSNNSLRIIHGGLRYLQSGNIFQIVDSIQDQARIIKESGALVKSLPCIMPLKRFGLKSRNVVEPAAHFYNFLMEQLIGESNQARILDADFIERHVPLLGDQAPHGALLWYDARVRDPEKLAGLLAHRIDREGGEIVTGAAVKEVEKQGKAFVTRFTKDDKQLEVCSRLVINATGAGIDQLPVIGVKKVPLSTPWAAGYNLVLSRTIQDRFAVGIGSKKSQRLFFVVPRGNVSVIGTGYIPKEQIESGQKFPAAVIKDFIEDFNDSADLSLTSEDVCSVDMGFIPVKKISRDGKKVSFHGRTQLIDHNGLIDILTTKYTTFHSVGRRALRLAARYLR